MWQPRRSEQAASAVTDLSPASELGDALRMPSQSDCNTRVTRRVAQEAAGIHWQAVDYSKMHNGLACDGSSDSSYSSSDESDADACALISDHHDGKHEREAASADLPVSSETAQVHIESILPSASNPLIAATERRLQLLMSHVRECDASLLSSLHGKCKQAGSPSKSVHLANVTTGVTYHCMLLSVV